MPTSRKTTEAALAAAAAMPSIPKDLIDQFVTGPMSAQAVNAASMAFKKALIERALGAELSHHLGYRSGATKPEDASNHRNGTSAKTVQIAEIDRQVQALLFAMCTDPTASDPDTPAQCTSRRPRKRPGVNAPAIPDLRNIPVQICGQDLSVLPALTEYSVLQPISEVGTDLNKWPTEKTLHCLDWARSGQPSKWQTQGLGQAQSQPRRATVLRPGEKPGSQQRPLGGFYRRMSACRGGLVANNALARKLAAVLWRVMVKGMDYVEEGLARYEGKVIESKQRSLRRLARQLGQQLVPARATA